MSEQRAVLSMWTVYDHPSDYPNSYVARRFDIDGKGVSPTGSLIIAPDLGTLRDMLEFEMHLTRLPRDEGDDPNIIETWI